MNPEFIKWWQNHRHSGYCFKYDPRLGHEVCRYGIHPETAYLMLHYRVEFEDATGISTGITSTQFNYFTSEERASWRKDQQEADKCAKEYGFTFDSDKNMKLWNSNFQTEREILREAFRQMGTKFSVREEMEKEDRELSEEEIEHQMNILHRSQSKKAA